MMANYSPQPEKVYEKEFKNKYRGEISVNIYKLPSAPEINKI